MPIILLVCLGILSSCGVEPPIISNGEGKKPFYPEFESFEENLGLISPGEEDKNYEGSFFFFHPEVTGSKIQQLLKLSKDIRSLKVEEKKIFLKNLDLEKNVTLTQKEKRKKIRELGEEWAELESQSTEKKLQILRTLHREQIGILALGGSRLTLKKQSPDEITVILRLTQDADEITSRFDLRKDVSSYDNVLFEKKTGKLTYEIPVRDNHKKFLHYQPFTENDAGFQLIEEPFWNDTKLVLELYPRTIQNVLDQVGGRIRLETNQGSTLFEGAMVFFESLEEGDLG